MYEYAIFPFDYQQDEPLEDLPVEMSSVILRYLDGASLLNAAKSSEKLLSICRGDPILRLRLREQLKKELEARRRYILDPSASVTVTRVQAKAGAFQKNVAKQVTMNRRQQAVGNYENLWSTRNTSAGKTKKAPKARAGPYKGVRM